jgi:pSer/pThr/pTyr-binding forkhead associated (FHA) protein
MDATKMTSGRALNDFLKEIAQLGREQYLAKYLHPILLIEQVTDEEDSSPLDDFKFATQRLPPKSDTNKQSNIEEIAEKIQSSTPNLAVLIVEKRDSKFQSIITLGRAPKSDLLINVASVSKFHCYFTHNAREDIWHISDADAANGTYLDGDRLEANTKAKLEDGAAVRLGIHVRGRFFYPNAFYDYITALIQILDKSGHSKAP